MIRKTAKLFFLLVFFPTLVFASRTSSRGGSSGGSGSGISSIRVEDEGVFVVNTATVDFEGAGVTATTSGGKAIVTIPGGSGGSGGSLSYGALYLSSMSITQTGIGTTPVKLSVFDINGISANTVPDQSQDQILVTTTAIFSVYFNVYSTGIGNFQNYFWIGVNGSTQAIRCPDTPSARCDGEGILSLTAGSTVTVMAAASIIGTTITVQSAALSLHSVGASGSGGGGGGGIATLPLPPGDTNYIWVTTGTIQPASFMVLGGTTTQKFVASNNSSTAQPMVLQNTSGSVGASVQLPFNIDTGYFNGTWGLWSIGDQGFGSPPVARADFYLRGAASGTLDDFLYMINNDISIPSSRPEFVLFKNGTQIYFSDELNYTSGIWGEAQKTIINPPNNFGNPSRVSLTAGSASSIELEFNTNYAIPSTGTISWNGTNLSLNNPVAFPSTILLGGTAGTAGQVMTSAGAGLPPTWSTSSGSSGASTATYITGPGIFITSSVFKTDVYSAGAGLCANTFGCTQGVQFQTSVTSTNFIGASFTNGSTQYWNAEVPLPENYVAGSTLTACIVWTSSATTGNVVWFVEMKVATSGVTMDGTWSSAASITDGMTTSYSLEFSPESSAITPSGPLQGKSSLFVRVSRGKGASDTLAVDAIFERIRITYLISQLSSRTQ